MDYYIINNASRAAAYGIGTYVRQLTELLVKIKYLDVYHIDLHSDVKEFSIIKDNLGVVHYQIPANNSHVETDLYCRTVCYLLASYISADEASIFHFNYHQHYTLALNLKARNIHCSIFLTIHYLNWCFELDGNVSKFRKIINDETIDDKYKQTKADYFINRSFLRFADFVIVLSDFCRMILIEDYKINIRKVHLIHNGLQEKTNKSTSQISKDPLLLFVGRLDKIKGVNFLIDAFRHVNEVHKDARLVLIGDGDYNECLKHCKGIWDKVTFTGKITREELVDFYNRATIGILPSFHEQCSYTAIEFMMHGIPFVATDSTGISEMLNVAPELKVHIEEENFSETTFVNDLVFRINLLLDNQHLRTRFAKQMYQQYISLYTSNTMSQKMTELIGHSVEDGKPLLSEDYLIELDNYMISLIHSKPDIDTDFFGISGIGVYLWWRINQMDQLENEAFIYKVKEYLIYYLDWLYEVLIETNDKNCCLELTYTLYSMQEIKFYRTRVNSLIKILHCESELEVMNTIPTDAEVLQNALRMTTFKF